MTDRVPVIEGYHTDVRDDIAPYVVPGGRLLDVGGGTGATAAFMKAQGLADSAGVVDQIASEQAVAGIDFHRSGNLDDPAFVDRVLADEGPFDTILCLDILEHLVDPWSLVARLHEALRPGGRIVASIPNVRHYRVSGRLFWRGRWDLADAGILDRTHLRFFVRETAIELMTHSGLDLELVATPPRMRHPRLAHALHRVAFGRLDSLVAVDYVVRVRRSA